MADTALPPISGFTAPGFNAVQDAFADNFARGEEQGAGFAVLLDGEVIVDLHGGWADRAGEKAWDAGTIVPVYSTSKGIAGSIRVHDFLCLKLGHRKCFHYVVVGDHGVIFSARDDDDAPSLTVCFLQLCNRRCSTLRCGVLPSHFLGKSLCFCFVTKDDVNIRDDRHYLFVKKLTNERS